MIAWRKGSSANHPVPVESKPSHSTDDSGNMIACRETIKET
jgi:hypothetical protein